MLALILIAQSVWIIWLFVLMTISTGSLKKRIDRASRHLEMTNQPEDPKPICGCGHHQCFHDERACWHNPDTYDVLPSPLIQLIRGENGERIKDTFKLPKCGCTHYTGPEALPTVIP